MSGDPSVYPSALEEPGPCPAGLAAYGIVVRLLDRLVEHDKLSRHDIANMLEGVASHFGKSGQREYAAKCVNELLVHFRSD